MSLSSEYFAFIIGDLRSQAGIDNDYASSTDHSEIILKKNKKKLNPNASQINFEGKVRCAD
jgi:hypothetical protein